MLGGENRTEVLRVRHGVRRIPLFSVDVPSSSERVRFSPQLPRSEPNEKVELVEVLRPSNLSTRQDLGSRKILQVLVVGYDVNSEGSSFKVMSPDAESFKDGEELLVVRVVV